MEKSVPCKNRYHLSGIIQNFEYKQQKTTLFSVVHVVDDTRLELVTSRTSSGCATSCANRPSINFKQRVFYTHRTVLSSIFLRSFLIFMKKMKAMSDSPYSSGEQIFPLFVHEKAENRRNQVS